MPVVGMANAELDLRLGEGFIVVLTTMVILDLIGTFLYERGIAKPFYLLGHRLHHKHFLLTFIPGAYLAVGAMIDLNYFRVLWSSFWPSVEITFLLGCACLIIDFTLDALSREPRKALLHHEWVYLVVPAYVFTHVVALV